MLVRVNLVCALYMYNQVPSLVLTTGTRNSIQKIYIVGTFFSLDRICWGFFGIEFRVPVF